MRNGWVFRALTLYIGLSGSEDQRFSHPSGVNSLEKLKNLKLANKIPIFFVTVTSDATCQLSLKFTFQIFFFKNYNHFKAKSGKC